MGKFHKDEKVRVSRSPKDPGRSPMFADEMGKYKGKVVTIARYDGEYYRIKEDGIDGAIYLSEKMKTVMNTISVPDIDKYVKRIKDNGGKIIVEPEEHKG